MILKIIVRFSLYLLLMFAISKCGAYIGTAWNIPKETHLIELLERSYIGWVILLGCIVFGITGTILIEKLTNFGK